MYQLGFDVNDFLANYWQKRPCVIRGGIKNFVDPITPDELAGFAMEESIESRLVQLDADGKWQAAHGPFESFDHLGEKNWVLLCQGANQWHPQIAELGHLYRFIPDWRFDDVMAGFSVDGGGVGPHIDHYDVFIMQGMGRRHWKVGEKLPLQEFAAHAALLHCEPFEAIIDVVLEPGDILYLPPGFPHEGYGREPSMSYSAGFRAPNGRELLTGFVDHLIDEEVLTERYTDANPVASTTAHGTISAHEVAGLRTLMQQTLNDEELFKSWFGHSKSRALHELDLLSLYDEPYCGADLAAELADGVPLVRLDGLRAFRFEGETHRCFIDGDEWPLNDVAGLSLLCDQLTISQEDLAKVTQQEEFLDLLSLLVNRGYWYFNGDLEE